MQSISNELPLDSSQKTVLTDGANIVIRHNEKTGLWQKQGLKKVRLVHEITIGDEEDSNKVFYRLNLVKCDRYGNIYENEIHEWIIRKYSKNGDYLLTIGHKGEGPGEFVGPIIFFIDAKNIINIFDQ